MNTPVHHAKSTALLKIVTWAAVLLNAEKDFSAENDRNEAIGYRKGLLFLLKSRVSSRSLYNFRHQHHQRSHCFEFLRSYDIVFLLKWNIPEDTFNPSPVESGYILSLQTV